METTSGLLLGNRRRGTTSRLHFDNSIISAKVNSLFSYVSIGIAVQAVVLTPFGLAGVV